ncbi:MAG TPA: class I SAM-dependent DNA methyltransferase [Longimicrobium sp.]|jgi:type I restriction enzyme M protein
MIRPTTVEELVDFLGRAMEILRTSVPLQEHTDFVASLLVLKVLNDNFEEHGLRAESGSGTPPFYVPRRARWDVLKGDPNPGDAINAAMTTLEGENAGLEGIFWGVDFNRLEPGLSKELIELFSRLDLREQRLLSPTAPGDAFEVMFERTAAQDRRSGELSTPPALAELMVRLASPQPRMDVCDPACGLGGFLTRCAPYVEESGAPSRAGAARVYGTERNRTLWARGRMNLLLHRLPPAHLSLGNALTGTEGPPRQYDRVVTHPPFSARGWSDGLSQEQLRERLPFGFPSRNSGDFAWIQHAYTSMKVGGAAVVLMPWGVLFRRETDGEIRRAMLKYGVIEGVVSLPAKLLYATPTPTVILIMRRHSASVTDAPVFFLDATAYPDLRDAQGLSPAAVRHLSQIYHDREEIAGCARMVPFGEIVRHDFVLNPGLYVQPDSATAPVHVEQTRERIRVLEKRGRSLARRMDRVIDEMQRNEPGASAGE